MKLKLIIAQQRRNEKIVVDVTVNALRGLIDMAKASEHLDIDISANQYVPVTRYAGNPSPRTHKAAVMTEEEFAREFEGQEGKPAEGRFLFERKRGALVVIIFDLSGGTRQREDMTIGLREADLTNQLARALGRQDMLMREQRQAEKGQKDRRLGRQGKDARRRIGALKQERNRQQ